MIPAAEKERWDKDFNIFWWKKAWVNSVVVRDIARKFVTQKNEVHGEGVFIMFCDNLSAQIDPEAK